METAASCANAHSINASCPVVRIALTIGDVVVTPSLLSEQPLQRSDALAARSGSSKGRTLMRSLMSEPSCVTSSMHLPQSFACGALSSLHFLPPHLRKPHAARRWRGSARRRNSGRRPHKPQAFVRLTHWYDLSTIAAAEEITVRSDSILTRGSDPGEQLAAPRRWPAAKRARAEF